MPSNPMQRKVRNSFLIGMLVMLLVAVLIGAVLFILMIKPILDDQKAEESVQYASVCILTTNVRSGSNISPDMVTVVDLPVDSVPTDRVATTFSEGTALVDLSAGTILCNSLLQDEEDKDTSERLVEYNMLTLQTTLDVGDFIDVRIAFGNGQDLIVVSGKEVIEVIDNTVTLRLSEGEILMMNSAIVEAYIMPTSNMYVTKYPADIYPGLEEQVTEPTYVPTDAVRELIDSNANITTTARNNFKSRWTNDVRTNINDQVNQYSAEKDLNIETGIREQIEKAQTARENYLSGF